MIDHIKRFPGTEHLFCWQHCLLVHSALLFYTYDYAFHFLIFCVCFCEIGLQLLLAHLPGWLLSQGNASFVRRLRKPPIFSHALTLFKWHRGDL